MNKVIVFGHDHTNTLGVIQSLGQVGYYCIGLLFGIKTDLIASSNYTKEIISAPSPQECLDKLLLNISYNEGNKIPIIPCCDIASILLERNSEKLVPYFTFGQAKNFSISNLAEKELQLKLAADADFNIPRSWNIGDSKEIPNDVVFPCLIKPLVSCEGAKSDIRVCRSQNELEQNLQTLGYTKNVLLQQYIEHDYEVCVIGCALSSGKVHIPAIENKLSQYPKNVGMVCLAEVQVLHDGPMKRSIENLISLIGYVGLFSVELMHCKHDDKFYFTEINLRNDGGEAFITKFGENLPQNHVEDLLGAALTEHKDLSPGYYIWDMHHFLSLLHREISLFQWLKEIKQSKSFITYFKEDKKPFYKQYLNWILSKLRLRKDEIYK